VLPSLVEVEVPALGHSSPPATCYPAGLSLFDPQQRWPERVMLVFGFVGIAVVAFAAGWLVGTALKSWQWLGG
jgi:hypothetical protein